MKVYMRNIEHEYDYPKDMILILDHLNEHGKLLVDGRVVERLYREFSEKCYCAGWIRVDYHTLNEFEIWLENYNL